MRGPPGACYLSGMQLNTQAALVLVAVILTLGACAYFKVPGAGACLVGIGGAVALFFQGRGVRRSIPPPAPKIDVDTDDRGVN